ncbi:MULTISPECIES: transposase [Okeania]|uniref:Tc1-like transposase DDE domain-containing protein n=1 Tax=Okeania hirsuta TaxID=1458930 RepID=A0A3N6QPC4_9CYAN|nr:MULTISPECIES: transposase [Okeania]NET15935.1 hypothetical protein [Okeania sp. SIO1H6]NES78756.1 hypothetical protein [Okeania sp. SIO1H4]NES90685.1 hypothetical protein [Okeania sp. SIO2B9]NET22261.1 hypothetical protein [Okeania sp. SIO1H5]NET79778.1 hypothetical protein [Okeania sp. SIO1F9]
MTRKKTFRTAQAGTTKNLEKRLDYWENVLDIQAKNLVFLDETAINLAMTRTYGRSAKGNKVDDTRPDERGTNLTLIGAISLSGFSGIMTIDSGTIQELIINNYLSLKTRGLTNHEKFFLFSPEKGRRIPTISR